MSYTLFAGCSYTVGIGFALEKQEPRLWVNQLHNRLFSHTTQLNVSNGGRSNAGIFQDTINALLKYPVEYAFVEWTSMPRYELELGFEPYSTRQCFMPNGQCSDHNLNNVNYTSDYLNSIRDRFTSLAHDCYEILNLVEYTNTIINLSKLTNTKVFFINGLCPWDDNFFTRVDNVPPNQYTKYTQQLLNVDSRDDLEILELYNKMHNQIDELGGINPEHWLNLYDSMRTNKIDVNSDKLHPGKLTNDKYTNMFIDVLTHLY